MWALIHYYYYRYSALGPVWAETRVQSGDWYGSGTLHPGQVLRGSLPLLSLTLIHVAKENRCRVAEMKLLRITAGHSITDRRRKFII